jgi:hypothetical protein
MRVMIAYVVVCMRLVEIVICVRQRFQLQLLAVTIFEWKMSGPQRTLCVLRRSEAQEPERQGILRLTDV